MGADLVDFYIVHNNIHIANRTSRYGHPKHEQGLFSLAIDVPITTESMRIRIWSNAAVPGTAYYTAVKSLRLAGGSAPGVSSLLPGNGYFEIELPLQLECETMFGMQMPGRRADVKLRRCSRGFSLL